MGSIFSRYPKEQKGPNFVVRNRLYRILGIVGQGGEATVYRCEDQSATQYAVKVFYFSRYNRNDLPQRVKKFRKEAKILRYLSQRSSHFVRLFDYEYKPLENIGYMILELGEGSLRQNLNGFPLPDELRRSYWKQIVTILTDLEDANVVHADIKPENLILVNNVLKLTDLGLAFGSPSAQTAVIRPKVGGTLDYMAPEVFYRKTGSKSDVWSAGIILYEMAYGRPPFIGIVDRVAKIAAITSNSPIFLPPLADFYLLDCLKRCLQADFRRRPTPRQLASHSYSQIQMTHFNVDAQLSSKLSEDKEQVEEATRHLLTSSTNIEIQLGTKKMPSSKKKSTANSAAAGGGDSSMFGLNLGQLKSLMELHGKDLMEKLNTSEYNGVKGVLEKLKVDGNKGLDSSNEQDLEARRTAYGRNEIPPKPMKSFLKLCWDALHDMLLIILLVCAVVSIGLSFYKPPKDENDHSSEEQNLEWIEGVAILVAVLVVVFVTAFNDWRKERQFRGLQNKIEKDQQTSVVRDNRIQQIPVTELVVGDLCFIKYGDLLPADGLLVQASDLKIDESSLTGETDLIKKNENDDVCLLSGTHVMEGSGRMVVTGVGLNSQVGNIMSLLGATEGGSKDKKKKKEKKNKSKKSSTRVSPDTSPKNDKKEGTVTTENEQKSSSKRVKRLPPLGKSIDDDSKQEDPTDQTNRPTTSSSAESKMENGETKIERKHSETLEKKDKPEEIPEKKDESQQKSRRKSSETPKKEEVKTKTDNLEENVSKKVNGEKKTTDKPEAIGDKKGEGKQNDGEAKPAGLAAMAEQGNNNDDNEGQAKDGKHQSVLQAKLTQLALYIGYIGISAAALTFICLVIRFCIQNYVVKKKASKGSDVSHFVSFLIQAITVVVVSVPEGLPLAVTLALAYAVRKMMTDNNLVRHLDACETMGNASTICSDKTGTLTTNRMTVVQCFVNDKHHEQLPKTEELNKDLLPLLFESISVNTNYTSKIEEAKKDEGGLPKQVGNKTECALLDLVQKWGGNYDQIRQDIPEDKLVKVYTFNSARKMMSTIIQRDEGFRLYTKGASEMVLSKCKSILSENNQPKDLNDEEKKRITQDVIEKMANDGLRTICVCYRDLGKEQQNWDDEEKIIKDLICIAIVGIEDPVRPEVPEAIEKCQRAGVVVRMVTGDNIMTARSIATKCGILKPNDDFLVLEGKEFNKRIRDASGKISQKKLDEIWPKLRVLARSSPQDKYNLVNGIVESQATEHREVVAVTGDGTNDGPALKRADVGFAMGIQGTDVAKQASDIILTDDNFSSIVKAMMWGRNVYDCIAKFLQFQLTANLSAGVISVVCAAAISTVPLRAVQMLWVNLVMDTLASLALATEPPTEELLNRKPYGRTKSIISPMMMRNILGQSLYQLVIMFIILYTGQYFLDVDSTVNKIQEDPSVEKELSDQFTMVFNAFVLMTLFNEINARKLHGERNVFKGIWRNPFFYGIWLFCFGAQILIVTFGDRVFSCVQLDVKQWAWCLLFGVGSLIWQQILLFIPIEPFSRCFIGIYRLCCPCCSRRRMKISDERENSEEFKSKRMSKDDQHGSKEMVTPKYMTISLLTNATGVIAPPPTFAKFMLKKSVNRLNSEFNVINQFRSRLEEVKEKKQEEANENRRNSLVHDAEV